MLFDQESKKIGASFFIKKDFVNHLFNTDENIIFKINTFLSSEYTKIKTISFSQYKSSDEDVHLIEVDLLPEKMARKLDEKVINNKSICSNIGLLYFVDHWVGKDDNNYIMYYSRTYDITITTTDELDLMAFKRKSIIVDINE